MTQFTWEERFTVVAPSMLSFALIFTDLIEDFVSIKFNQTTSSIECSFHIQQENPLKSCSVVFGPGGDCKNLSQSSSGNSTTNSSVIINLNNIIEQDSNDSELHCFHVTAANGTFTVVMKRIFNVPSIATNTSSSVTVSCSPTDLSYRTVLDPRSSNMVMCGVKSFYPLGIKNGIVCYNGTDVGAIAVYSCLGCHFRESSYETFIRMCKEDGKWSGTIPQCDCSESSIFPLFYYTLLISILHVATGYFIGIETLGISVGTAFLVLLIMIFVLIGLSVALCRAKVKLQRTVKMPTQEDQDQVYEEVILRHAHRVDIDTQPNISYATHRKL